MLCFRSEMKLYVVLFLFIYRNCKGLTGVLILQKTKNIWKQLVWMQDPVIGGQNLFFSSRLYYISAPNAGVFFKAFFLFDYGNTQRTEVT